LVLSKIAKPYPKNKNKKNKSKKLLGRVAQVLEHLPSKRKALSSNCSSTKKKKKTKNKVIKI
jgi:hypothetical protein